MQTATAYATSLSRRLPMPLPVTTMRMLRTAMILQYAEDGYDCDGVCLNDADDGVCTSSRSPVVKTTRLQLQCGCYGQR